MKNLILITIILLNAMFVKAQTTEFLKYGYEEFGMILNYQEEHPKEYRENILYHAKDKWGGNYDLVNLEVRNQIVAQHKIYMRLIMVGGLFKIPGESVSYSSELEIIKRLIVKWSYPGWADSNRSIVSTDDFNYKDFKDAHCDWRMVLTDYEAILVKRNLQ